MSIQKGRKTTKDDEKQLFTTAVKIHFYNGNSFTGESVQKFLKLHPFITQINHKTTKNGFSKPVKITGFQRIPN